MRKKRNDKKKRKIIFLFVIFIIILLLFLSIIVLLKSNNNNNNNNVDISDVNHDDNEVKIIDINSKTRPYAIMVSCHEAALPQAGLDKAYIVYELMVEFGVTRMMALYKDVEVEKIGSIRSARDQYLAYVFENDAVYVHAGGQEETLNRISKEKINHIDVDGKYGIRDKFLKRAWEHTLFSNTSLLKKGMNEKKIRNTTDVDNILEYSPISINMDKYKTIDANNVSIKYSDYRTSNYKYDSANKYYLRSMNNKDNVDLVTKEQYSVKNIIVYGVKYTTYTAHGYYGYQKMNNIGTGEGYYITEGKALPIIWIKDSESSQTIYKIKETGEDLIVNDGNTYIQIYPLSGNLDIH